MTSSLSPKHQNSNEGQVVEDSQKSILKSDLIVRARSFYFIPHFSRVSILESTWHLESNANQGGHISWDCRDGELALQRGFSIQMNKLRPRESSALCMVMQQV